MEALICPECGGRVDQPSAGSEFAKCAYCSTSFRFGEQAPAPGNFAKHGLTERRPSGPAGMIFIGVIVLGIVIFAVVKFVSVQRTTNKTVNDAQQVVNDAQSAANAMKQAANAMANAARQKAINALPPSASPSPNK